MLCDFVKRDVFPKEKCNFGTENILIAILKIAAIDACDSCNVCVKLLIHSLA